MELRTILANASAEQLRAAAARLAANLPPPEDVKPRPSGVLCAHARDTGELAFIGLPCRGNRIECRKTGVLSYAAACRADKCRFYEEGEN